MSHGCGCANNSTTTVKLSDRFDYCSASNSDQRSDSFSSLFELFESNLNSSFKADAETQKESPLTGTTVQIRDDTEDVWLILTPVGTLADLDFKYPIASGSSPNATDKQEVTVSTTQILTAVTHDGNGATVLGAPTSMTANGFFRMKYDSVNNTWYRIG